LPAPPIIGEIKPSKDGPSTGSVALSGLPSDDWTIESNPATVTITGSGTSKIITGLASGTYTFTVRGDNIGCVSLASESAVVTSSIELKGTFPKEIVAAEIPETQDLDSNENRILVVTLNKVINVNSSNQKIDKVFVYDVSGNLIYKKDKVENSKLVIDNLRSGNQVLVVKVVLDNNQTKTQKVIY
jgi:hypothetical protein